MNCDNCQRTGAGTYKLIESQWLCPDCGNFRPTPLKDGFLTRNSPRLQWQREKYAADFVQPYTYDRTRRQQIPNPDFIKLYPQQVNEIYSKEEIHSEGLTKLAEHNKSIKTETKKKVQSFKDQALKFAGSTKRGIKKILSWYN